MNVTRLKARLTEMDEVELRSFYESCGLTGRTIERAIKVRKGLPSDEMKPNAVSAGAKHSQPHRK